MITLDKLAPYLPYKLKIDYLGKKVVMNAGSGSSTNWIGINAVIQRQDKCKPILRPMTDLVNPCLGKGIKPIDALKTLCEQRQVSYLKLIGMLIYPISCDYWPYWVVEKLINWHFDVFGLIKSGDAIILSSTTIPKEGEALVRFKEGHPKKRF